MIYLGYPVLTEDPNRRDIPSHILQLAKKRVVSETGAFAEVVKGIAQQQVRPFSWFIGSRADYNNFADFRNMTMGRLSPFWVPTWQHDLILKEEVAALSTILPFQNIGYTRYFWDTTIKWRRYLAFIQIGTGISFIRQVNNAVESSAIQETLTIDSGVPVKLNLGEWMVSFLTFCRNESDTFETHWHGPALAEVALVFREIPLEAP